MADRPHDARTDRGISRSATNTLITSPIKRQRGLFPCWCGENLVNRYRMMTDCCVEYLTDISWYLVRIDLAVDTPQEITIRAEKLEYFHTLRRADGSEIGGDFAFYTAASESDWDGAEADAYDLDEQQEYWLDTWVLVRRQSRMLGPEPVVLCPNCDEPIEDHDAEERKVCHDAHDRDQRVRSTPSREAAGDLSTDPEGGPD